MNNPRLNEAEMLRERAGMIEDSVVAVNDLFDLIDEDWN